MLRSLWLGLAAALLRTAAAVDATYHDPDTGLNFAFDYEQLYSSSGNGHGITYRIAIPSGVQSNTAYDAVVQVVVPNEVGWAGLAWGGTMPENPLLVAWRDYSNKPVLSSRWATGHVPPQPYSGATYKLFKTGTKSNSTHWQFTALCTGCTSWTSSSSASGTTYLNPRGSNRIGFAYSTQRPSNPGSSSSSIPVHDVEGYWSHDCCAQAANANFAATVQRLTS